MDRQRNCLSHHGLRSARTQVSFVMSKKPSRKIVRRIRDRRLTPEETARYREVRNKVLREFPPSPTPKLRPAAHGIGAQIRAAREARGMTWYAVAKQAGIPNPGTVRDIEYGRD